MVAGIMNYFSRGSAAPAAVVEEKESPIKALPSSWYTSTEMYELERRAIFSRKWLFITHRLRLAQPGDYLRYDIAGFQVVLARDREGKINGFHNVCRHRAYPVVAEEKGTARIFSCKYHGWSYGLNGKLAKAPGYQELSNFDKNANGLFPIHVHVDSHGFVWVNLDGKEKPELSWEGEFGGIDLQPRLESYNFDEYTFDHSWETEGEFNWKIAADNYNECYHCTTNHPDIPTIADLDSYSVNTSKSCIEHNVPFTPEQQAQGHTVAPTFFFPNAAMNVTPQFFVIQKFIPTTHKTTSLRYEVFRHPSAASTTIPLLTQTYLTTASSTVTTLSLTQKNLESGTFIAGEMHPQLEKGPLFFQKLVRETVLAHHKREQDVKEEIWPARQTTSKEARKTKEEIDFCSGLACAPAAKEGLAW